MSQIYIDADASLALPLSITNPNEIDGATEDSLVVGGANGELVALGVANDGEILIGSTGTTPVLTTITAGTNISITNGPGSITINATGGGLGPEFADNAFRVYDSDFPTSKVAFDCVNITPGSVRTITMCDQNLSLISPSFPGSVTAGTGLTVTTGDATVSAGNINIPTTNAALNQGVITQNGNPLIHSYGSDNLFVGVNSGNGTTTGDFNTGLGRDSLNGVTSGSVNTALGYGALGLLTEGGNNLAMGGVALANLTTGLENTAIGASAGANYTSNESSNICINNSGTLGDDHKIRIGTQGSGIGEQNNTFIAGIYGNTVANPSMVVIDPNGELGTTTTSPINEFNDNDFRIYDNGDDTKELAFDCVNISSGVRRTITMDDRNIDMDAVATTYATDGADATAAAGQLTIAGSGAISTAGAGATVTISSTSLVWSEVTGTSQAAAINNGYIANNVAQVTVTLPDTAAIGSIIRVVGKGDGGWKIAQNAGETIYWDESTATTTGVGGYLESTQDTDSVELLCITADTEWQVIGAMGNITVV